jgi:hypothetical protein
MLLYICLTANSFVLSNLILMRTINVQASIMSKHFTKSDKPRWFGNTLFALVIFCLLQLDLQFMDSPRSGRRHSGLDSEREASAEV